VKGDDQIPRDQQVCLTEKSANPSHVHNVDLHTAVSVGPMFKYLIRVEIGTIVDRGGFNVADFLASPKQ
jgi:hypothetical protein